MSTGGWMVFAAVLVVFSTWFAVIVLATLRVLTTHPRMGRLRAFDQPMFLRFVPIWTFFAPKPGVQDLHLVWRDAGAGGAGPWREITDMKPERGIASFLWNPDKRFAKTIYDLTNDLIAESNSRGANSETLTLTIPYLLLGSIASRAAKECALVEFLQFAIVADSGASPTVQPVFASRIHAV